MSQQYLIVFLRACRRKQAVRICKERSLSKKYGSKFLVWQGYRTTASFL